MNLLELEPKLTQAENLSHEAKHLAQTIISTLRQSKTDAHIVTTKVLLGKLCRALEIKSMKTKDINQYYTTFWESEAMIISVMVSTEVSLFETMGEIFKPAFNNQKQKR